MTKMTTPLIWKKLIIERHKIVTSAEIRRLALNLDKGEERSLRYLQEHGYIYRILRGIFYVKSPEEREKGFFECSKYEMVSKAMKQKGIRNWYFGLETALLLNNMTHEYFVVNYVITDSYRTTKIINILDTKFQFHKWSKKHFMFGIIRKSGLAYSDREKTVLDLAYKIYLRESDSRRVTSPLRDYETYLNQSNLSTYLEFYPPGFRELLRRYS